MPAFITSKIPFYRRLVRDATRMGRRRPYIQALFEVDITPIREVLRQQRRIGKSSSLTGAMVWAAAQAVKEDFSVQAIPARRSSVAVYMEVDVLFPIELETPEGKVVFPFVLLNAHARAIDSLSDEINRIKQSNQIPLDRLQRRFLHWPAFMRDVFYRLWYKNPAIFKKQLGTIGVSTLGMYGHGGGWGIGIPLHTISLYLGSIEDKVKLENGKPESWQSLHITLCADHDLVDGAALVRFAHRLKYIAEQEVIKSLQAS